MTAIELATAYISLVPEGSKVGPAFAKLEQQAAAAGTAAGQKYGNAMSAALSKSTGATDKAKTSTAALTAATDKATTSAKNVGAAAQAASGQVSQLGKSADAAEGGLSRMQKLAATGAGLVALGGLAVAAAKALLDVGDTFANVSKTLQVTTGATGAALDGMKQSVDNIARSSPKSFGEISQTLATLAQRTNLTGAPLETLTKQVLKLNGFGGQFTTDIGGATAAMAAFGVKGSDMGPVLDQLFKVSQSTGVSMDTLTAAAVKGAPQFQQFGLNLAETAGLMGSLDKAGISSDTIMTGLSKAMNNFANAGKDPKQALDETIKSIHALTESGQDAKALDLANNIFGAKGAGQFVNAVKSGAISVDGLSAALDSQKGGILDQAGAIPTLSAAWAVFKNNIMIELEPIATRVFGVFTKGITWIKEHGVPAIKEFGEWMRNNKDVMQLVGTVLSGVVIAITAITVATKIWAGVQAVLNVVMSANPISLVIVAIAALVAGFIYAYNHSDKFREIVQKAWAGIKSAAETAWNFIKPILQGLAEFIMNDVVPAIMWLWHNVIEPAFSAIKTVFDVWWAGVQIIFNAWKTVLLDVVAPAVMWLWHNVIEPAFSAIKQVFDVWWAGVQIVFEAWKVAFNAVGDVVMWLWHNIIEPGFQGISTVISTAWTIIQGVFEALKAGFSAVGDFFTGVKDRIGQNWDAIVGFVTSMPGKIADAAKGMWNGITQAFKDAINWIIRGWNSIEFKIPGFKVGPVGYDGFTLGLPDIPEMRDGGMFRGKGGPREDANLIRVSDREYVMPADVTAKTLPFLEALRAGWIPGADFLHAMVPGYAGGGLVTDEENARMGGGTVNAALWSTIKSNFPDASLMSAKTDHDVDGGYHPAGKAIDIAGPNMMGIAQWIASNYGGSLELIHAEGFTHNIKDGKDVGDGMSLYGAGTMSEHADHVHWAMADIPSGATLAATTKPAVTEEDRVADAIIAEGRKQGVSEKGIKIALAVALAESGLKNLDHGPDTSIGSFQQQDSWGTKEQRMDPAYAASKFYDELKKTDYENMDPAAAAQSVQRSAFSDGSNYSAQMSKANDVYGQRSINITSDGKGLNSSSGSGTPVSVTNWPSGLGTSSNSSSSSTSTSPNSATTSSPSSGVAPDSAQPALATFGDKMSGAGQDFLKANVDQFVGDLGLPADGGGYFQSILQEGTKLASWRPPVQINNNITVSNERTQVRKLKEQQDLALMQYGGAG